MRDCFLMLANSFIRSEYDVFFDEYFDHDKKDFRKLRRNSPENFSAILNGRIIDFEPAEFDALFISL